MKFKSIITSLCLCGATFAAQAQAYLDTSLPVADRVEDLLARMTLDEKVLQLQNRGVGSANDIPANFASGSVGTVHEMDHSAAETSEIYRTLQNYLKANDRLGIPVITCVEGIQGVLIDGCTIFPHAIAQGATFNTELQRQWAQAAAEEARVIGVRQFLSPVFDIPRELRWGRVEETYGEDPFLIAKMGIAYVDGCQSRGVTCMPKHFVAHGSPSGGLNCAHVAGGERELQSLYLYPFRKVIEACHPWGVMTCYSAYDGVPGTGNRRWLTDILRHQLGHKGYVYSDWGSVERLMTFHHAAASPQEAARMALHAGCDVDVDWTYSTLADQVRRGLVPVDEIDEAARRVLTAKFALGMFDEEWACPEKVAEVVHSPTHIALSKRVADESAILLENNGILPLDTKKYKKIAIIGPNGDFAVMGDYSWVRPEAGEGVSLLQGLRDRLPKAQITYTQGCDWWSTDKSGIDAAVEAAKKADVVIAAIGTRSTFLGRGPKYSTSGEGFDLSSLELPGCQQQLLEAVKAAGKPMIVAFISGKPLAMPWVKDNADAVIAQWYAGEQQGAALADVILGNVNPSGRVNVSFPRSTGNTPCFYNHYPTDREEPFDRPGTPEAPAGHYIFDTPEPLWNFGHGLSYSKFEYLSATIADSTLYPSDTIKVTVKVANVSKRDGKEVVQVYVRDKVSSVATPIQQLKGFSKVMIPAGESRIVEISIPVKELSLWNAEMREVVEPGEFEIQVGPASDDIRFVRTLTVNEDLRWGDLADGTYANPVLNGDFSDPDVIRVGDKYYLTCSEFHFMGMPVLESEDMVNWKVVARVHSSLPGYDGVDKYGQGTWAPAIRHHNGTFYIYVCSPNEGLWVTTAKDPCGPWSEMKLIKQVAGWEDPCPYWDSEGNCFLGRSQLGGGPIYVHRMSPDGMEVLDEGIKVYDGPVAEGTKFFGKDGYVYLSIPEGGVSTGWQTVLRAKSIYGPYEGKVCLEQGATDINGPHQGALVDTPDGDWWFYHFQSTPVLGRVVHLQPVKWAEGYPVIGTDIDGNGIGEPVRIMKKPLASASSPSHPQSSDNFDGNDISIFWQFNHNPNQKAYDLKSRKGWLKWKAAISPCLRQSRNQLTQKMMGYAGNAETKIDASDFATGQRAGILCIGRNHHGAGVMLDKDGLKIYKEADGEVVAATALKDASTVYIRLIVNPQGGNRFFWSIDNKSFEPLGLPFSQYEGDWKGARVGLYNYNEISNAGVAAFDYFNYEYI